MAHEGVAFVHEPGQPGLHPGEELPVRDPGQRLAAAGYGRREPRRPLPHLGVGPKLPAGMDDDGIDLFHTALVRDGEPADGVDLVPPQLHADRLGLRRREDVEDPTADRELTS